MPSACFSTVPAASAALSNSFLNSTVAMLAFSIDFQSISFTCPADKACAKLYIARDASFVFAPDIAASLLIPLIARTASSSLTPALVNFPMFCVMSANE